MAKKDSQEEKDWLLGQLEAPVRAAAIGQAMRGRLGPLLDWGFAVQVSEGGVAVSLGQLSLLTVLCESDEANGDSVTNWVDTRSGPAEFTSRYVDISDKTGTLGIALIELDLALTQLRQVSEEIESPSIPMGWVKGGF